MILQNSYCRLYKESHMREKVESEVNSLWLKFTKTLQNWSRANTNTYWWTKWPIGMLVSLWALLLLLLGLFSWEGCSLLYLYTSMYDFYYPLFFSKKIKWRLLECLYPVVPSQIKKWHNTWFNFDLKTHFWKNVLICVGI